MYATQPAEAISEPEQKLQIQCGPDIEGSVAQAWWTINGEAMPVNFFRIVVNATKESQLVKNCTGFITRIEKDGKNKWGGNNAQVTFAQGDEPDALSKTIRYPMPEYLDVLVVTSRNQIFPGTKPGIGLRLWPFVPSMDEIFSEGGEYLLTIVITGDGVVPPVTAPLKFNWTEDWETAPLTLYSPSRESASPISLTKEGHLLTEQWTTRLDYPEKQRTGLQLRKECDKWIESGQRLRERLVEGGWLDEIINEARTWLDNFERFAELNFSNPISDYDRLVYFRKFLTPEPSELAERSRQYQRAVGYCYGHLSILRNKIV